jgi:hypothetical protein
MTPAMPTKVEHKVDPFYGYKWDKALGAYVRGLLCYRPLNDGNYVALALTDNERFIGIVQAPLGNPITAI